MKKLNISKELLIKIAIYLGIVIGGFAFDRVTKEIVKANLTLNLSKQITIIPNFLYFTYSVNTGGAWSILSNATWLLALISFGVVVAVSYYMFKKDLKLAYFIFLAMIVSGGLGNFYDRAFYGEVIDFIETYPFGYSYPIFNIADIFVVVGAIGMIIYMYIEERNEKKKLSEIKVEINENTPREEVKNDGEGN